MSKIPLPGPFGTTWIETDPEPMTAKEKRAFDRMNAKLDRDLTRVYQNKLAALGYPATFNDAKALYESTFEERQRIDDEYFQLEVRHRMDEMVGSIEKIQRERGL